MKFDEIIDLNLIRIDVETWLKKQRNLINIILKSDEKIGLIFYKKT